MADANSRSESPRYTLAAYSLSTPMQIRWLLFARQSAFQPAFVSVVLPLTFRWHENKGLTLAAISDNTAPSSSEVLISRNADNARHSRSAS